MSGRYLCPSCLASVELPVEHRARLEVHSVSLLLEYLGSDILTAGETGVSAEALVRYLGRSGLRAASSGAAPRSGDGDR